MKKYPSRIRYEKSHPTISFRLDRDLKKRLEKMLEGKSFADFVKEGLGIREREKESLKSAHDEGYAEGFDDGCEHAERMFGVYTTCAICGERMIVRAPGLKKALSRYIKEQGWGHEVCMSEIRMRRR